MRNMIQSNYVLFIKIKIIIEPTQTYSLFYFTNTEKTMPLK